MKQYHRADGKPSADAFQALPPKPRKDLDARDMAVIKEIHANTYSELEQSLAQPALPEAYGFEQMRKYWDREFDRGDPRYGISQRTIPHRPERAARTLADFFFWTAWAAGARRPGLDYSYTNNWPSDPTVGNTASTEALICSIGSILSLLAVLGLVVYVVHRYGFFYGESKAVEAAYRLLEMPVTPSQRPVRSSFSWPGCCSSCRSSTADCWPTTPSIPARST